MAAFRVIIETTAISDLRDILRYITETLKAPQTAQQIYISLKGQILTLDHMAFRYPLVNYETFAARGLRKMPVENYLVFYVADKAKKEVHILRVLHNRREWRNLL
jgi:toxin ParE1/3/4